MSFLAYFLLYIRNAPAPIRPRTAAPPINPPTIAPVSLDLLLLDEGAVGPTVAGFVDVDELIELDEVWEEDVEDVEELEVESEAAELRSAARLIDWKIRLVLSPEMVVNAVCQVDVSSALQKYCSTVAPGTAYRMLPQYGEALLVHFIV